MIVGCGGVCTRLENSIVALNGGGNCAGSVTGDGLHDLVFGDATCPGTDADPLLGTLQVNGAPTAAMALLTGSPAIDAVPPSADCPSTDQRGVTRPHGAACDIGAYEWAPPTLSGASATATGSTGAVVAAGVNPNAQPTTVTVRYGPTASYGSTTASQGAGAATTSAPARFQLSGLSPGTTYHAQMVAVNPDGTASTADLTATTTGSGGARLPGGGPARPAITNLHQSAARWREGAGAAAISATRRLPIGTTFSFALNEPAALTFSFTHAQPGRRLGRRCLADSSTNAGRPRCVRIVTAGVLRLAGRAGTDRVYFAGRLSRRHRLAPGRCTLVLTAVDGAHRRSAPQRLRFTIVR